MAETEYDPLALDNQLCFSLYAASRALTGLYRELLGDLGLTYPQYLVMLALWEHGTLSVKGLSRVLHLDSGTLSPLLRRLEAAGAITRTRSAADERVVEIGLTERGAAMRERALGIPEQLTCASGQPADRVRDLITTLDELTRSVENAAARRPCGTG
ncbi:MarR family winged helix-turn-helix transcriptional regulator [Nocardiopsis changdeensis]|uniref:MarR family transcriptional regulator n=1 Tax=Nocardiopsis changdeensis TaxID=2831969 RepID=A0ABX8BVZ1_9ACTN|nr:MULTISPECIES: MarR family transcriptional regulator [Nocardiopsis]QUX25379.1 MarR family transcriptional regulator [Nocardiopsis changdeensis]QYX35765.1 MarR family transcriptional regulator [Nocardiopsis sp. MT53]